MVKSSWFFGSNSYSQPTFIFLSLNTGIILVDLESSIFLSLLSQWGPHEKSYIAPKDFENLTFKCLTYITFLTWASCPNFAIFLRPLNKRDKIDSDSPRQIEKLVIDLKHRKKNPVNAYGPFPSSFVFSAQC